MQDPVTQRFLESYRHLRDSGKIRSARQFAMSIDVYPQSFNEILKGRREVTIKLLRQACTVYPINSNYILTGSGDCILDNANSHQFCGGNPVPVICPHKHQLYAQEKLNLQEVDHWSLPSNWCGQRIEIAFQTRRMDLKPMLASGDILFCRKLESRDWGAHIISGRLYVLVTGEQLFICRVSDTYADRIIITPAAAEPKLELSFSDLREVWIPQHKWSSQINDYHSLPDQNALQKTIQRQKIAIEQLNATIAHVMKQGNHVNERATAVPDPVSI